MFYKPRSTATIKDNDVKVSLVGKVVEIGEDYFILDDGLGSKKISSSFKVDEDETIRVFCSVSNGELSADIVQVLDGLDLELFKKVDDMFNTL